LKGREDLEIGRTAVAGSLEASDVQVTVGPAEGQVALDLSSSVLGQYGRQIRRVVLDTLATLGVEAARVTVVDKGALDCIIRARTECAVYRAMGYGGPIPWGGELKP
jgi:citrate lyase subunit gamma (acyl carrier protein)